MTCYYRLKDLSEDFELNPKFLQDYLKGLTINNNSKSVNENNSNYYLNSDNLIKLLDLVKADYLSFDIPLLNFIICHRFKDLIKDNNIILQFTNRSKLIQQRDLSKFEKLPESLKEDYYHFADKVLAWIKTKLFSDNLTKIIIDRITNCNKQNNADIRITFYEGSQVDDLYLIVQKEIDNLKELKLNQSNKEIKNNNHLLAQLKNILNNSEDILLDMSKLLEKINDEQHIRQIFKLIIGVESSYRVVTSPDLMIIGFNKLNLPSKLEVNYNNNLELNFNNGCSFICQIEENNDSKKLVINLADLPKDLELISL
ncbi:hypothetical protein BX659_101136 [Orenia metallireducens]|jgi:hypothetical protein|uniref:Uncharacterized protein n=1 Tax=Orenia metallireducens TaxID=1413210 RepID=A0A285FYZ8_9FIRM|nr:hypothetical protein [Orenia metallireducens]PRX35642.1 hypothetical protein BX659_101136 [Orenia metallireducens]SNY15546.1 hypothetical protein SAMN06265827_10354 [Orenia metallireducens]